MRTFITAVGLILCFGLPTATATQPESAQPNIVFILADDLGYGDLGCYGQKRLATPNLDRLANQGMRFTRHYAGMTVCAPSRCVLMTGLHSGHSTVRTNWDPPMPIGTLTIARKLRDVGYATGAFGKWGIGNVIPENDPQEKGFDRFYGYVDMYHAHNFFPPFMVRNGTREPLRNDLIPGSDDGPNSGRGNGVSANPTDYAPDFIRQEAIKFIETHANERFFLYLALNMPHANNEGGKASFQRGMEVPSYGEFANQDWPNPERGFARMMEHIDQSVAMVVGRLQELGLSDRTLVIFTSDNGPHQEGGHHVDFFDSNGNLRGRKRDLYEGGIRVPLIAYWPGKIASASTNAHLSGFQDWMPTLCELAGAPVPAQCDGLSLVPTLLGNHGKQPKHDSLYFEFYEGGGKQAVVTERWKCVRLNWNDKPNGPVELYDLESDESEQTSLADSNSEIVQQMLERLSVAHTPHLGSTTPPDRGGKENSTR